MTDTDHSSQIEKVVLEARLEIYRQHWEQFRHYDQLRWQAPGIALASGAAILALSGDKPWFPPSLATALFGGVLLFSAYMIYRIRAAISRNRLDLQRIAETIGDPSVPSMSGRFGATSVMGIFLLVAGLAMLVWSYVLWL
ncbi:MAG: hypothetical protein WD066_04140 [Planctomycetaceae bacterium]